MNAAQSAIESYYVESSDGLLFAVKGLIHPPHRLVAYLRYAPDPNGDRVRGTLRYRRLYHFEKQEEFLRDRYPTYLSFDPVFGEEIQNVPYERVAWIYDPCLKLAELRHQRGLDELQEKGVEFTNLLQERAKVPGRNIGVSGSVLVDLHTPSSDIDIVIYGSEYCHAIHKVLTDLLDEPRSGVKRLDREEMRKLYSSRSQDTPMSFEEFCRLEGRKVIQGKFRGCEYFIRFVKAVTEVGERYGEGRHLSLGQAEIEATVVDASEAIFTPCIYKIEDVQLVKAQHGGLLPEEIVSYRGRFCEQAREGERVIAAGKLERVVAREGKTYHRLILGGRGHFMTVQVN